MQAIDFTMPYSSARSPVMGREAIATSQPLASMAGMEILAAGGNAVDAAVAAAMVLTVVEPTGCGIGSDAFAIVWDGAALHGLDASGRAPAGWTPDRFHRQPAMPERGWESVTVPGAVSGWIALARRFGRLPLKRLAEPAIRHAREGFAVTPIIAELWRRGASLLGHQPGFADCFMRDGRPPQAGDIFRSDTQAATLESIASSEGEAFYRGELAQRIVHDAKRHGAAMSLDDLASHKVEWVAPLAQPFAGAVVHELPPAGQGLATLMALGILEAFGWTPTAPDDVEETHLAIEATKLAITDLNRHVGDRSSMTVCMSDLLDVRYLRRRSAMINVNRAGDPGYGKPGPGGTVCLSAGDATGMMVSFIQSNYMGFGSGVVVPGTGISLQNRGAGFSLDAGHVNCVGSRKRPFHTIIPGFATDAGGAPLMAFGLMGGPMQAQGHVQMALRILRYRQNPQAAADAPRWRLLGRRRVAVEPAMSAALVTGLRDRGHEIVVEPLDATFGFGGAQIVLRDRGGYIAGSDPRKDGQAVAR